MRTIAMVWKKLAASFAQVKSTLLTLMIHEKMTSILHDSHAKFPQSVGPVMILRCSNLAPNQPRPL